MKLFVKYGGILCAITLIMGLLLGLVNSVTEPVIEQLAQQTRLQSIKEVLSGDITGDEIIYEVQSSRYIESIAEYPTTEGRGFAVTAVPKGYGGTISLMIGLNQEGVVTGVSVMDMSETAGLGAKAKEQKFLEQFKNNNTEITAITGATVTTNAVKLGVSEAIKEVGIILKGVVK
ncbi:MAG: FMN-binding protein [Clostridia bacterium]|nr:FMN-binding protein [Clostridia bacterium]